MMTFIHSAVSNARCAVTTHSPLSLLAENRPESLIETASASPDRPRSDRISDMGTDVLPGSTYFKVL